MYDLSADSLQLRLSHLTAPASDDLTIKSSKSVKMLGKPVVITEACTKTAEDPNYQQNFSTVAFLVEQIPDLIELRPEQNETEIIWISIVQSDSSNIEATFRKMHANDANLMAAHTSEWRKFWNKRRITTHGND